MDLGLKLKCVGGHLRGGWRVKARMSKNSERRLGLLL
jgi:hypothetical protein